MTFSPSTLHDLPESPGIYKFLDTNGDILYVGKAKKIRKRVSNYFQNKDLDQKTSIMVGQIKHIDIIPVQSEFEALLLEAKLIKTHRPKYNINWKDDKQYVYIVLTREAFPRVLVSRKSKQNETDGEYFGPFPSSRTVRGMLRFVRTIIPYCTQSPRIKKACFYTHIGLCHPCPGQIRQFVGAQDEKKQYLQNIHNVRMLLSGKHTWVKKELEKEMRTFGKEEKYEEAARIRDRVQHLDYLVNHYTDAESYIENPSLVSEIRIKEGEELVAVLHPYFSHVSHINHIECYDISNISGVDATGSMVTFVGGEPDKSKYRRFKIRMKKTPDDFAMLKEILSRRLKHKEWNLPDLFVIDGGAPQLRALRDVLRTFEITKPVVGLAKRFEEIVVPQRDSFTKIRLGRNSRALHLLQRLRDEAHRFARRYHVFLRKKSVLQD